MSELDPNAWPHDNEQPHGEGPALDDQAALAFEIAAMRVRASWDDLDAPIDRAPAPLAAPPMDASAPIVPAPMASAPEGLRPPEALGSVREPSLAAPASPSSAVDTAPMVFLQATPVAAPAGQVQRVPAAFGPTDDAFRAPGPAHFDHAPAPTFLPSNKLGKPAWIAIAAAIAIGGIWLLGSGDDASEAARAGSTSEPAPSTPLARVETPVATVPSPGAVTRATAKPEEMGLAAVTPAASTPPPAAPEAAAQVAPALAPPPAVEAPSETARSAEPAHRETKSAESSRRRKRAAASSEQSRAQHHESVASARPAKRKVETARPAASETAKRKGTGFVSANPY